MVQMRSSFFATIFMVLGFHLHKFNKRLYRYDTGNTDIFNVENKIHILDILFFRHVIILANRCSLTVLQIERRR